MPTLPAREMKLIRSVLHRLNQVPGLRAQHRIGGRPPFSGLLQLSGTWGELVRPIRLAWRISPQQAELLRFQLHTLRDEHPVLLADYIGDSLAQALMADDLAFFDSAGNGFLQAAPLYYRCTGQRGARPAPLPNRCTQRAGLKILYQLLRDPTLADAPYRAIAAAAGVALGTVGPVIQDLLAKGLLHGSDGQRQLGDLEALHQLWEPAFIERLRPRLQVQRCRLNRPWHLGSLPGLIREQGLTDQVLLGGELAAACYCPHTQPQQASLHFPATLVLLKPLLQLRLLPDPDGPIDIVRQFATNQAFARTSAEGVRLSDPLSLRAELLYLGTPPRQALAAQLTRDYLFGANSATLKGATPCGDDFC
ncbi:type IV toxin-antitoxin system AbiEi family antitoxin [Desulfuromonas thiophila]|uniref:Transcriptional regulator, AbiEi antitoxin, Type IV TA system n=1 Tax=Desulfuromonas thiophila TaxID=57664 RepID=A0A1G6ZQL6_9BACT|nr:type IV toxin-antitoxin system AbiEi family antitoxin [Desulfuromonas thiophila]SDE04782.1 hypothetical protein SAMN05661003_10379 [Desulfuromonas thiophila]